METGSWLVELGLQDGTVERFEVTDAGGSSPGGYELLFAVEGRASRTPTHGVFARWLVRDGSYAPAFEQSRRELFGLRREHIESFVCDLLLRPVATHKSEFVVLGLYSAEDGPRLAREHPAIAEWAASHPASRFTADDVTGMRFGIVNEWSRP